MSNTPRISVPLRRRTLVRAAVLGAGASLLAKPYVARAAKRYSIAVIPKSLDNPAFDYAHYGAETRAKELGDVDVIWTGSTTADASVEAQILSGLIARHIDAMAVDAAAAEPLVGPINQAVDKGIVVITWDSDVPKSKRKLFYGVDSFKMGQLLGENTIKFMGDKGTVILVSGPPGVSNLSQRLGGVKAVLAKYPGVKMLGPFFDYDDMVKGQELMDNLLVSHPDAGAIVNVAAVAFFGKVSAMPQVIKNKGKVKLICSDTLAAELPFVADGYVQALVGQDYWGWGYQTVSIIHN
ncbi:MAG: substrate-binding domain-containing protein, partial [Acetobacteraceae bacterium]